MAHYVETSALVKLVRDEGEGQALRRWLVEPGRVVLTSDLARTELLRAVRRHDIADTLAARAVLDGLEIMVLTTDICERAATLSPSSLRSLDAIHLAAALTLGDDLDAIVSYDARVAEAAAELGVPVIAPR